VVGVTSDILFPAWQQRELADLLDGVAPRVVHRELESPYGHDAFLIERRRLGPVIGSFLSS